MFLLSGFCGSIQAETSLYSKILAEKGQDDPTLPLNDRKETDANVMGHIIDAKTKEHLPYIKVYIEGTTLGTLSDATGHYFLKNLPEGKYVLVMESAGFKTVHKNIEVKKGKTIEVNFTAEEDLIAFDNVVVSANRNETSKRMAPSLVNILDSKLFETTNASCLAEGLSFQSGARLETNCQNCGFQQIRINGLDGPYTQIMVDSRPIFSSLTGVYGLEQIPANMIERVEVIRGGGSALFGSSAIAGTLNIITKEPQRNSAHVSHKLTLTGKKPENVTDINASMVTDDQKAGIYVFGQYRHRAPYDANGDGFTEVGILDARTVGFRSYIKTTDLSKLTFEYHNINEYRRGGDSLDLQPHLANIAEQTNHVINGGGLRYELSSRNLKHRFLAYASSQHTSRKSYYGAEKNADAYGQTRDITVVGGAQYTLKWADKLWLPAELTAGSEYQYNDLKDEMPGYGRTILQTIHNGSVFLQNEWKNKYWGFLIGGRMDKHNLLKNVVFNPRANIRYNPTENLNFRLSYASGFRAPQAFDEDLHIAAVGARAMLIEIDPNLKKETSQSLSLSADYYKRFGDVQTNFLIEGFYNDLKDVFFLDERGEDAQGNLVFVRTNKKGARVMGINLEAKIAYKWAQLQAGATYQQSRYKEAETWSDNPNIAPQKKMFRSPDVYGYFTATLNPIERLSVALTGTYTGSMLVQHLAGYIPEDREETTPDFWDINMKVAYDIPLYKSTSLQLNAGVQNIFNAYQKDFDKGVSRDAGYIYGPGLPRRYFIGCKISY